MSALAPPKPFGEIPIMVYGWPLMLKRTSDKIASAALALPEFVARDDHWNVRVRLGFGGVIKPPTKGRYAHKGEIILRGQEGKAPLDFVIPADAGDGEFQRGDIGENLGALPQLAKFVVGESAIIVVGVLPAVVNVDHLFGVNWHHWPKNDAVDQGENGRVNANRECQGQYRHGSEAGRLQELSQSKFEI